MLTLKTTAKFKKDYKWMKKQDRNMSLLGIVIVILLDENNLDEKYRDYPLSWNYVEFRECHILPEWFLIYAIDKNQLILIPSRTSTHSDLFDL